MSHAAEFDEYGHKDHGHVIVSLFTLRFILIALLICTLLTSGSAWAEEAISSTFHVVIPQWINVCVALSIAVVKTALVVGFFMQLKYDNPMNTIIFVFTILTVFSFLGFTGLDLGNRDTMDRFKNQYVYPGGNLGAGGKIAEDMPVGEPIVTRAQRLAEAQGRTAHHEESDEPKPTLTITEMGYLPPEPKAGSSSNLSRPVTGITMSDLPGYHVPKAAHGAEHAAPAAEHAPGAEPKGSATPQTKPEHTPEAKPEPKAEPKPEHNSEPKHE